MLPRFLGHDVAYGDLVQAKSPGQKTARRLFVVTADSGFIFGSLAQAQEVAQ